MGDTTGSKDEISSYDLIEAITSLIDDLDSRNKPKYCLHGSNHTFMGEGGWVVGWIKWK